MSTLALDGVEPRSRVDDPTTSVDAGRAARLRESQENVLLVFAIEDRPLADHELVEAAKRHGSKFSPQRIRSARAELARDGMFVLVENESRRTENGGPARVWALAEGNN